MHSFFHFLREKIHLYLVVLWILSIRTIFRRGYVIYVEALDSLEEQAASLTLLISGTSASCVTISVLFLLFHINDDVSRCTARSSVWMSQEQTS